MILLAPGPLHLEFLNILTTVYRNGLSSMDDQGGARERAWDTRLFDTPQG